MKEAEERRREDFRLFNQKRELLRRAGVFDSVFAVVKDYPLPENEDVWKLICQFNGSPSLLIAIERKTVETKQDKDLTWKHSAYVSFDGNEIKVTGKKIFFEGRIPQNQIAKFEFTHAVRNALNQPERYVYFPISSTF
jgi:hypothetical protein